MDEEDRKPFEEKAAKDKERYESEKSAYTVSVIIGFLADCKQKE
jgi:hypothetical protein